MYTLELSSLMFSCNRNAHELWSVCFQVMGSAGGLTSLSKMPACNMLVLGAQRRTLSGFSSTATLPHTGHIYYSELVQVCICSCVDIVRDISRGVLWPVCRAKCNLGYVKKESKLASSLPFVWGSNMWAVFSGPGIPYSPTYKPHSRISRTHSSRRNFWGKNLLMYWIHD